MSFKDIAIPLAMLSIPVIRLQPKSKLPMDKSWQLKATTDVDTILLWNSETPTANCGSVAKANGFLFFEIDEPGVIERYEKETGEKLPKTFTVQSRKGYHFYFSQTDESRACGSITQKEIPFGSLRQNNAYCVSPGSTHPETGQSYTVVDESPIVPIPTPLINWLRLKANGNGNSKKADSQPTRTGELIQHGQIHPAMTSEAGRLRKYGYEPHAIESALLDWVHTNCQPPIDDDKVKQCARSMGNYKVDDPRLNDLINGYKKLGNVDEVIPAGQALEQGVVAQSPVFDYPLWVWEGTLFEDFARTCGEGNFVPREFFIECVKTVVGAICGHRVQLETARDRQPSRFYTTIVGLAGSGKSEAAKWSLELFAGTGLIYEINQNGAYMNIGCARARFGSAVGMVKNGFSKKTRILQYYDEFTAIIASMGIPGSGGPYLDALNELYETTSMSLDSIVKDTKDVSTQVGDRFQGFQNSILGCTTPARWQNAFNNTVTDSSGFLQRLNVIGNETKKRVAILTPPDLTALRDQFMKKIQPLEFQNVVVRWYPEALAMFNAWFDAKQKVWEDSLMSEDISGRINVLAQRNISLLAWLMSGDVEPDASKANEPIEVWCDEDIVRRGIALAEYELVQRELYKPIEADNQYARAEADIKRYLAHHKTCPRKVLYDVLHVERYGVKIFDGAIANLQQEGYIKIARIEGETKRGRKTQIIMLVEE